MRHINGLILTIYNNHLLNHQHALIRNKSQNSRDEYERYCIGTGRRLLDTMIQIYNDHLAQGNSFTIPELGTFSVHTRERHRSYNPHYEQYLMLPPKRVVKFSPGKSLKENVKHTTTEDE